VEGALYLVLTMLCAAGIAAILLRLRAADRRARVYHRALRRRLDALHSAVHGLRVARVGIKAPPGEAPGAWLVLVPEEPHDEGKPPEGEEPR
jgi:hypothetical protein